MRAIQKTMILALPRESAPTRIGAMLCCTMQHIHDRNKEHSKYELVSGSGPFWAGLAELCTVAHFVYTACRMEIMIFNQGIDICVGRPLLWCVP